MGRDRALGFWETVKLLLGPWWARVLWSVGLGASVYGCLPMFLSAEQLKPLTPLPPQVSKWFVVGLLMSGLVVLVFRSIALVRQFADTARSAQNTPAPKPVVIASPAPPTMPALQAHKLRGLLTTLGDYHEALAHLIRPDALEAAGDGSTWVRRVLHEMDRIGRLSTDLPRSIAVRLEALDPVECKAPDKFDWHPRDVLGRAVAMLRAMKEVEQMIQQRIAQLERS